MRPERSLQALPATLLAILLVSFSILSGCGSKPIVQPTGTTALALIVPATHTQAPTATSGPSTATQVSTVNRPTATMDLNCTYTLYYWENNPDKWLTENIIIGRINYTKEDALAILAMDSQDGITLTLKQFFAAALNILKGADSNAVELEMSSASVWLDQHPLGAELPEDELKKGSDLAIKLEAYNSGVIGPGLCEDEPSTPTASPTLTPTITPTPTRTSIPIIPTSSATATQRPRPAAPTATEAPTDTLVPPATPTERPAATATQRPAETKEPTPTSAPTEPPAPPTSSPILPTLPLPTLP